MSVGVAAALGGRTSDNILMRLTDITYAFPDLLFIILLRSVFERPPWSRARRPAAAGDDRDCDGELDHDCPPCSRPDAVAGGTRLRHGGAHAGRQQLAHRHAAHAAEHAGARDRRLCLRHPRRHLRRGGAGLPRPGRCRLPRPALAILSRTATTTCRSTPGSSRSRRELSPC